MTLEEKLALLDELKMEIIALRERIQSIEGEIAVEICPVKVGDTITIDDGRRRYEGLVEDVGTLYSPYDLIEPTIGNRPTWRVRGPRINKGSGETGKWSFEIIGNRVRFENGVWVMKKGKNLDDLFNL